MALGVSVLAGFGGRDIYNLARAVLNDNVTVLTDRTSLHGVGLGGAGIGRLEVNVVVLVVRHDETTFCGGERVAKERSAASEKQNVKVKRNNKGKLAEKSERNKRKERKGSGASPTTLGEGRPNAPPYESPDVNSA